MSIRVLLADDQAMVRAGFGMILQAQPDIEVVGEAEDGEEAVAATARLEPDVVVMDVQMPRVDGVAATREILAAGGRVPRVLVVTTFDIDDYVYDALRAGASGFLLKNAPPEELVHAVRVVASGDSLLAPSVTRRLVEAFCRQRSTPREQAARLDELTPREREVLTLVAGGLSNGEIAGVLHVSHGTVKTHVANIFMKLDVRDRVQAVVLAYEVGLVAAGSADAGSTSAG